MRRSDTKRVAILVAGMHRSGTSALARVLSIAGCDLPKTLMKPKRDNVTGFWESQAILDLNQEILASAGSYWDDWRPFDQDWYTSPKADEFRERARELIQSEFGSSRLFVLKDPRICRLMKFWIETLGASSIQPLVVSPIRNPFDAASSLHVRSGTDPSVGQLSWLRHVLDAEVASRSLKRAYLRYEQLLSETQALIGRLGDDLGVSWPKSSSPHTEIEIDEFLSPELHHHSSEDVSIRSNPCHSDWIKTTFDIFDRWSRGEVRTEDIPDIDRIKAAFDDATPAFSRAMAAGQTAERKSQTLSKELDASRSEVREREDRINFLSKDLETSWREVVKRDDRIRTSSQELDSVAEELEASRQVAAQRQEQIASLSQEIETSLRGVTERDERIWTLSQELDTMAKELETSRQVAAQRQEQIASLSQEIETSQRGVMERNERIRTLSQKLDTAAKELETSRLVAALSKERVASLSQEMETSRRVAAEREGWIQAISQEMETSRQVATQRKEQITSLSQEIETSRQVASQRKEQIASLSQEIETSRQVASQRKEQIASLSQEAETSRQVASQRKEQIASLSQEIDTSRQVASQRKEQIASLSQEAETSRRVAAQRKEQIASLSQEIETSRQVAAQREQQIESLSNELVLSRLGHIIAFAHRRSRLGIKQLEVNILLNPEWIDQAEQRRDGEPILELRRNGRIMAQVFKRDLLHHSVQIAMEAHIPTTGTTLYSIHDAFTGKALAALAAPAFRQARRVIGAVENRPLPEVRGWLLDPANPNQSRRVAVHLDGHLHAVLNADKHRADIARWKGTDGHHGFLWPIPDALAVKDGTHIAVFDADTGRPLRGSPIRIESKQAVASGRRRA